MGQLSHRNGCCGSASSLVLDKLLMLFTWHRHTLANKEKKDLACLNPGVHPQMLSSQLHPTTLWCQKAVCWPQDTPLFPDTHQPSSLNHETWEDIEYFSHIFKSQDSTKINIYASCSQVLMKWRSRFSGAESGLFLKNSLLSLNSGDPLACTTVRPLAYPRAGSWKQGRPAPKSEQNQCSPGASR